MARRTLPSWAPLSPCGSEPLSALTRHVTRVAPGCSLHLQASGTRSGQEAGQQGGKLQASQPRGPESAPRLRVIGWVYPTHNACEGPSLPFPPNARSLQSLSSLMLHLILALELPTQPWPCPL